MSSLPEKSLAEFYASYNSLANASDDLVLEDARFVRFTELLQIGNIIYNPTVCRYSGGPNNQPWGLLGYSLTEEMNGITEESELNGDEDGETSDLSNEIESTYRYTFIHGFYGVDSIVAIFSGSFEFKNLL